MYKFAKEWLLFDCLDRLKKSLCRGRKMIESTLLCNGELLLIHEIAHYVLIWSGEK